MLSLWTVQEFLRFLIRQINGLTELIPAYLQSIILTW